MNLWSKACSFVSGASLAAVVTRTLYAGVAKGREGARSERDLNVLRMGAIYVRWFYAGWDACSIHEPNCKSSLSAFLREYINVCTYLYPSKHVYVLARVWVTREKFGYNQTHKLTAGVYTYNLWVMDRTHPLHSQQLHVGEILSYYLHLGLRWS